jgi:hypothetical protein
MTTVHVERGHRIAIVESAWKVVRQEGLVYTGQTICVKVVGESQYFAEILARVAWSSSRIIYMITTPAHSHPRYIAFSRTPEHFPEIPPSTRAM